MDNIAVYLPGETIRFTGQERVDLETPNWIYFECNKGVVQHFRKENVEAIGVFRFPAVLQRIEGFNLGLMMQYIVRLTSMEFNFVGKYSRLSENEWHHYATIYGLHLRFNKQKLMYVRGDTAKSVWENR